MSHGCDLPGVPAHTDIRAGPARLGLAWPLPRCAYWLLTCTVWSPSDRVARGWGRSFVDAAPVTATIAGLHARAPYMRSPSGRRTSRICSMETPHHKGWHIGCN